jgi:hypothetical protein
MTELIRGFDQKIEYLMKHNRWDEVTQVAKDYEAYQRLMKPLCYYELQWTDEVGEIMVCQVHGNNSKHDLEKDPHANCITVDPWPTSDLSEVIAYHDEQMRLADNLPQNRYRS